MANIGKYMVDHAGDGMGRISKEHYYFLFEDWDEEIFVSSWPMEAQRH